MTILEPTETETLAQPVTVVTSPPTLCYDIIIIGGGVAGLSAGIYAARDGFKTLILEGTDVSSVDYPGGALMLTSDIQNFPGFPNGEGMELISTIRMQAEMFGAEIVRERAEFVDFSRILGGLHLAHASDGNIYRTKSIILATGAVAKQLDVPGESTFYGRGVSTCATCDGAFFRNKVVAVVGGGDTAIEDALYLARDAEKVFLLPRRKELRAQGPEAREILEHPKVEIIWGAVVDSILGDKKVEGLIYNQEGQLNDLIVDGVFVAIGRAPSTSFLVNTELAENVDGDGYITTMPGSTLVSMDVPGVFAAGDAVDRIFRQAITSAGKAVEAALEARHYLLTVKRTVNADKLIL